MKQIEIRRARVMGFCMGVRRAMEKALDISGSRNGARLFTLGPLIHNRLCIEDLEERGVHIARSAEEIEQGDVVIIRAHGVPPDLRDVLEKKGAVLVDATCPRVLKSQKRVREFADGNYHIVIVGDRNHGEIIGLAGFARSCSIIQEVGDAESFTYDEALHAGLMVIAQTTLRQEEYDRIAAVIRGRYPQAEIINSICPATRQRQESLIELADSVDALIIVGGKDSANTTRLYRTALSTGKPVWHIEEASELPQEIVSYGRIGISAGASTPDSIVDEVERHIRSRVSG